MIVSLAWCMHITCRRAGGSLARVQVPSESGARVAEKGAPGGVHTRGQGLTAFAPVRREKRLESAVKRRGISGRARPAVARRNAAETVSR